MGSHTLQQLKRYSFDELKELFETTMKNVNTFVPVETEDRRRASELEVGIQEQPEEEEKEMSQEDLQQMMMVVPIEEVYVEALQVKYPIIDWEVYTEESRKYWKIIRVGNHTEAYQFFEDMLKVFDRDDLVMLWNLRYMHDPLKWRLYDTCGVHHVYTERGIDIFMLVKKEYPLSKEVQTLMLVNKLLVEQHSEMANELLRKIFIQANRPRQ
ncbi:hypothetical protein Tco_0819636 [Tanacetum coccineum]|uniref:Uncharacterized protein n=1 Tax=Tanacetum coccineum TaxID=301880 RepID=A0ABQ5AA74_9ASTR